MRLARVLHDGKLAVHTTSWIQQRRKVQREEREKRSRNDSGMCLERPWNDPGTVSERLWNDLHTLQAQMFEHSWYDAGTLPHHYDPGKIPEYYWNVSWTMYTLHATTPAVDFSGVGLFSIARYSELGSTF